MKPERVAKIRRRMGGLQYLFHGITKSVIINS